LEGAGWGGCVVSLIPEDKKDEFFKSVYDNYYSKDKRLSNLFTNSVFSTKPSHGIFIILKK
jgi:galactokinase